MSKDNMSVKSALAEAKAEIQKERRESAKLKLKAKLKEIQSAEIILANLNRELDALQIELAEGIE